MEDLQHYQKLQLRDRVCNIRLTDLNEIQTYKLQGRLLHGAGFSRIEARYPRDTWVGTYRQKGWDMAKQEYADSKVAEMKLAGIKATELMGHLKDRHGFNTEEDQVFIDVIDVFGYNGPW